MAEACSLAPCSRGRSVLLVHGRGNSWLATPACSVWYCAKLLAEGCTAQSLYGVI